MDVIQDLELQQYSVSYWYIENFTSKKPEQEMTSAESLLSTIDEKYADTGTERVVLPLANPYIAVYLIIIVTAAIVSNSVVLTVMSIRRKKLRTFQLCLVSVCVSDLLFSLLLHPMSIATALGYNAHQIFSYSGCLYFGVLALFFGSYDMVIHSVIAVLRYINLCHPAKSKCFSTRIIFLIITACVTYSAMWCIGPIFGVGKYVTFEVGCTMAFADGTLPGRTFVNCAFIFIFFIPLSLTIFSYVAIVLEASKQRKALERIGTVNAVGTRRLAVELKLVRLTSVIAAAYIIVWFPYAVVCLAEAYGNSQSIPWIFRILAALFCKTGTATNPVIYLFLSKGFRRETIETIRVLLRSKNQGFSQSLLYSSSQKSSSCRSQSQISLRSSRCSRRKDQFSQQRIIHDNTNTHTDQNTTTSLNHCETCL